MKNLRMLIIRNAQFSGGLLRVPSNLRMLDWEEYPSQCLTSDFLPEKIAMLELRRSHLTLDKPFKKHANLISLNLSSCEFLTRVPDVSGIPNLEQLIIEDRTSLVEIHESVGSLDKLFYLGVESCTKLKNFPSALKMQSLGCIILNGCSQLEKFPYLLGKMEKLRIIEVEETAIQELPSCVVNLSSLAILTLKHCSNLKELPLTIDMLPNLQSLDISGCPQLQLFPDKLRSFSTQNCSTMPSEFDESSPNLELQTAPFLDLISPCIHSSYGFPLMETLDLSDCKLSDEDLHVLSCFSNLTALDISANHFVTLPKCFNRLSSLQELDMANCRKLQQISGIPPNLEHIDATSCTRLNSQSLNLLLSQGFCKASKYEVIAPRPRTPIPFNYHSKGGSVSFWIGHKFPKIALCFIFGLGNKISGFFTCGVQLSINGQEASNKVQHFLRVTGDHTWLYHQEDLMDLNTYLLHEQNYVEVSCEIRDWGNAAEVTTVRCCGVHEYKEEEEVKKIDLMLCTSSGPNNTSVGCKVDNYLDGTQFSCETRDNPCHYDVNMGIDCCSFPKNLRLHEISDVQWKQLSASIDAEMLEGDRCMAQENGKTTTIMLADAMHLSKEKPSLHLQLYDDETWDPMLLECQLNHKKENELVPAYCHIYDNTEVGPALVTALVPQAFDNIALKEDSDSQEIGLKIDDVLVESQEPPELSENSCCSERKRTENSWNQAEATGGATFKSRSTQEAPPAIHPSENFTLSDQDLKPKGPPVLEYETKRDKLVVIPMEHNTSQFDLTLRDDTMEAFYAALHAETFALSPLRDPKDESEFGYPKMSEETKKALEILKEFLSKQFCQLLDPGTSTSMKDALEYLSTLSAEDEASLGLKSLILQISTAFTQWSLDYIDASMKFKSSYTGLSKLDTLEEGLIANKNQFSEFVSIENELRRQLAYLEERIKELEEQINAIKANISISAVARESGLRKKRETYEQGRMLKAQRDELMKQRPRLRAEQELAKATKGNIEDEWSKIREKFERILNIFGSNYRN